MWSREREMRTLKRELGSEVSVFSSSSLPAPSLQHHGALYQTSSQYARTSPRPGTSFLFRRTFGQIPSLRSLHLLPVLAAQKGSLCIKLR